MRGAVNDGPEKLTVAAEIVNETLPEETVTFSAVSRVAVRVTTTVDLMTENPMSIAPENATASATVE